MIVVSNAYALSASALPIGLPIIGWQNLVTVATISADEADASYPVSNLANPSTALRWQGLDTSDQHITVLFGLTQTVDYIAVARHNWGSTAVTVSVEGLPFGGNPATDGDWDQIVEEALLVDDSPALFRWVATDLIGVRIKLQPGAVIPRASVVFAGKLLELIKGIPPGHTPINYGRTSQVVGLRSQGGDLLGTIVLNSSLASSIVQQQLDPTWYRANLEPFRLASNDATFFFAWAPRDYPREVGYCNLTSDAVPVINQKNGLIDITFPIGGVAL